MVKNNEQIEQIAPLRAVLSRRFVAYEGTHITLACRHTLVRSKDTRSMRMRCPECAALAPPRHD